MGHISKEYIKNLKADLASLNLDLYFVPEATLDAVKEQFNGANLDSVDIQNIADGNFSEIFNRAEQWVVLPSGAGFVWKP